MGLSFFFYIVAKLRLKLWLISSEAIWSGTDNNTKQFYVMVQMMALDVERLEEKKCWNRSNKFSQSIKWIERKYIAITLSCN